jgi:hypothetical protein
MNITIGLYHFYYNEVIIKMPFEIERETEKCYFTKGSRYYKSDIGKPVLRYASSYPYIEVVMVDADEEALREKLGQWFTDKAYEVWKIRE